MKEDNIRLRPPLAPEDDLSDEEKKLREREESEQEKKKSEEGIIPWDGWT